MKKMHIISVVLLMSVFLFGCNQLNEGVSSVKEQNKISAEQIGEALLDKQFNQLYDQFGDGLKSIVTKEQFSEMSEQFIEGEQKLNLLANSQVNGYTTSIWKNEEQNKGILASVDEEGIIEGFLISPLTAYPETDELYSEVKYQLPFNDTWYVFWGGKDVMLNYHYEYEHMRYAYDFIKVIDNYSYNGDPLSNDSYYAFNQDIVAPAKGKVIKVIDGIADNIPGQMNEQQAEGNMVVIEHEHDEFSMIAHFKQNSIVVKEGDYVESGQLLGLTGNSGNSSEAHIHFQVSKIDENGKHVVIPVTFLEGQQWIKGQQAHN